MLMQVNQWHLKLKNLNARHYFLNESKAHSFRLLAEVCIKASQDAVLLEEQFSNIAAIRGFNQVHRVSLKRGDATWKYVQYRIIMQRKGSLAC